MKASKNPKPAIDGAKLNVAIENKRVSFGALLFSYSKEYVPIVHTLY